MKKKDIVKCLPALRHDSIMAEYFFLYRNHCTYLYAIFQCQTRFARRKSFEINLPVIIRLKIVNGSHFDYNQNILQQNLNFFRGPRDTTLMRDRIYFWKKKLVNVEYIN